jgi:hypothetical protein
VPLKIASPPVVAVDDAPTHVPLTVLDAVVVAIVSLIARPCPAAEFQTSAISDPLTGVLEVVVTVSLPAAPKNNASATAFVAAPEDHAVPDVPAGDAVVSRAVVARYDAAPSRTPPTLAPPVIVAVIADPDASDPTITREKMARWSEPLLFRTWLVYAPPVSETAIDPAVANHETATQILDPAAAAADVVIATIAAPLLEPLPRMLSRVIATSGRRYAATVPFNVGDGFEIVSVPLLTDWSAAYAMYAMSRSVAALPITL